MVLFHSSFLKTSNSLINSSYILRFAYFPKLIIPISMFAEKSLIFFVIHFIIFLLVIFVYLFNGYELSINWFYILLPFVILYISLLSVFLGMIISCWGARYRDLLQIGSYGSHYYFMERYYLFDEICS